MAATASAWGRGQGPGPGRDAAAPGPPHPLSGMLYPALSLSMVARIRPPLLARGTGRSSRRREQLERQPPSPRGAGSNRRVSDPDSSRMGSRQWHQARPHGGWTSAAPLVWAA
jgi:hypothetical protein